MAIWWFQGLVKLLVGILDMRVSPVMAVSAMLLMLVGGLQGNNIQYYD
ncbi:MAG: hypothetical protein GY696_27665 [Gammaproteobacteria bacterium]|nr:hypothetical protein [Gammaproteobacteria bacterium]